MTEEVREIQGQIVDSEDEWVLGQVLMYRKVEFIYQYSLDGGRVKGGQVIDFVILSPLRFALYVGHGEGGYWHGGAREMEDKIKQDRARRAGFEVVLFTIEETSDFSHCLAAFDAKVGL